MRRGDGCESLTTAPVNVLSHHKLSVALVVSVWTPGGSHAESRP